MLNFFHGGINTVYFITNNIDKTIEYYRDFLGLPLYISVKNQDKDWKLYIFSVDNDFSIGFYEWKAYKPLPPKSPGQAVTGPFSFDHLMIGVEKEEDLWLLRDKFLMAGLEITDVVDHGFVYSLYTTDPVNNISLEFAYQTYNLYDMPMFMDAAPSALADEGAFPKEKNWPVVNENPVYEKKQLDLPITEISSEYQLNQEQLGLDYHHFPYNTYYNRINSTKLFFSFEASNHIIFFATNNMDETIRFYRDLLGFKLINTFGDGHNHFKLYMFAVNESLSIAFFYWPTVKPISRKHSGIPYYWWRWNSDSLSLGVSSVDKVWLLYERFLAVGINVSAVGNNGLSTSFEIFDPNNICIKIEAFTVDLSKKPLLLDSEKSETASLGLPQESIWPTELDITPKTQRSLHLLPGVGFDLIPAEMKNAELKVDLVREFDEEEN
jgi:catechol 2,3-dioxygenase-like lactoylglutathione lyase family enzyme